MAKEIATVHQFDEQSHSFGLKKEKTVVRCDDGSVYEFMRPEDEPVARLVRRFKSDGSMSTSRGVLPQAVKETISDMFGNWQK